MTNQARGGFTFIEVILILLVVVLGLLGAIGLASYGSVLASRAQGNSLGMITAVSIANDQQPLLDPAVSGDWLCTPLNLDATGTTTGDASGYVNGFYVVRHEVSEPEDIIAKSGTKVYARRCTVQATVYQTTGGRQIATFVTQIVRQRGTP
jgi:hypothetical protein